MMIQRSEPRTQRLLASDGAGVNPKANASARLQWQTLPRPERLSANEIEKRLCSIMPVRGRYRMVKRRGVCIHTLLGNGRLKDGSALFKLRGKAACGNTKANLPPYAFDIITTLALRHQGYGAKEIMKRLGRSGYAYATIHKLLESVGLVSDKHKAEVKARADENLQSWPGVNMAEVKTGWMQGIKFFGKMERKHDSMYRKEFIPEKNYCPERWQQHKEKKTQLWIKHTLRKQLRKYVKGGHKKKSAVDLVGCEIKQLREHLESQFERGMNWNNYGTHWHIDHIFPCAKWDLTDIEQQKQCFHYTNLRPMRAKENIAKSDKVTAPRQLVLL